MRDLEGRIILVTGAAGGIGKEICKRFAEEGSIVIATDLNALGLEDLKSRLNDLLVKVFTPLAREESSPFPKHLHENRRVMVLL